MNLYKVGDDPNGLYDQIAAEMYKSWQAKRRPVK
jgi:hypothetical protein